MLDAFTPGEVLCLLLIDRLVDNVTLVASHDYRCVLSNLVDQLSVPLRCTLERVLICHIVDQKGSCRVLIVYFSQGVVLFLTCSVPNDQLHSLVVYKHCFLEVASIDS